MEKKKSILVIDDEEIVRMSCERILRPVGFHVDAARDGIEAFELLDKSDYGLILTDLKMPNMDGLELMSEILRRQPGAKVIIITGYGTTETAVKAIKMGAHNYIEKPFGPDTLLYAVREAFEEQTS